MRSVPVSDLKMHDIIVFLMTYYYDQYKNIRPPYEVLSFALRAYPQKFVIMVDERRNIQGIAAYVTLDEETYRGLDSVDISDLRIMSRLIRQEGPHYHVVLLASVCGYRCIMEGIRIIKRRGAKSISWWNPSMTRLHNYSLA